MYIRIYCSSQVGLDVRFRTELLRFHFTQRYRIFAFQIYIYIIHAGFKGIPLPNLLTSLFRNQVRETIHPVAYTVGLVVPTLLARPPEASHSPWFKLDVLQLITGYTVLRRFPGRNLSALAISKPMNLWGQRPQ